MGSCVSKKAAGGRGGKVAAPLPVVEKEGGVHALPPVAEVDAEQEEEVKEVVLSETPAPHPPRPPPPEPLKRRQQQQQPEPEEHEAAASETCSAASDGAASSVESSAAKAKAKLQKPGVDMMDVEKRAAADAPAKGRAAPPEEKPEGKQPKGGSGRARSPSPAHRNQQQQQPVSGAGHPPAPARPRREQQQHPPVVSGIGCRSGRFSPSAARRAAESAVRRTHSAREADMALPSKRSLAAGAALSRRDPGERSGRRSDSPTGSRRAPASPSATTHRPASPMRKAAKEHGHGTPERARPPRVRDDGDELAGSGEEQKKVAEGEAGALGQNPSVAMECFIFL